MNTVLLQNIPIITRLTSLCTPHYGPPVLHEVLYTFPCFQHVTVKSYSQPHFFHIFPTDRHLSFTGGGNRGLFLFLTPKQLFIYRLLVYILQTLSHAYMTYYKIQIQIQIIYFSMYIALH